ncbi:GNAT family N-acetyltransferase [candidate division KSB1 bacterium]|nr:GNAT family N-acetyltransferase [candidate division KSB1 bacterium]
MSNAVNHVRDATHDILRYQRQSLDAIFSPQRIAVIGATERAGSVGQAVLANLMNNHFGGTVFPINPNRESVLGLTAYPRVTQAPGPIDLAIIATPAPTVPSLVGDCAAAGVRAAIILSADFQRRTDDATALEQEVLAQARRGRMRIIGPNSVGVMRPHTKLNATYARAMAQPGHVGFISQSGALGAAILDWSMRVQAGFSAFISVGTMLDVGWGDLIYYLGDDPRTKSIILYMETIGDAASFLSAAREVALTKPIIVLKARHAPAASFANSQVANSSNSEEVFDAAIRRCGVLRVNTIAELFYMAEVLDKQPRPKGPALTILTNAGGPGLLAADAVQANGGKLAPLSAEAKEQLDQLLPANWSHGNPIDILGDAEPERYAQAITIAAKDANSNGLLVILTPLALADPTLTAELVIAHAQNLDAPLLASWMGGADVAAGQALLNRAGIPAFPFPDTAARMFAYMWQYTENLRGLYETPMLPADFAEASIDQQQANGVIQLARQENRIQLTEAESRNLLAAYGIPVLSPEIEAHGYELFAGSSINPQFGPVLIFGAGGELGEAVHDRSFALPPLTTTLARRMMEKTRIYPALRAKHELAPADFAALEQMLVRLSWLVVEQRWIKAIDCRSVIISKETLGVRAARVKLHETTLPEEHLPKPAIRPYPRQYVTTWTLRNGAPVTIRPIRPEDEPLMVQFHQKLSERTVYLRYFHLITLNQRIAHERLTRICFIDYDREMVMVVERTSAAGAEREIIGVGRLSKSHGANEAEFAALVSDSYQGQGLGSALMRRLIDIGRAEKFDRISADILPDNDGMQRVCKKLGMQLRFDPEEGVIRATMDL